MAQSLLQCLQSSMSVKEKFRARNDIFKQLTASQVDEILAELKTTSNYDAVRLKLADDYKRSSCVLDILENGDKASISHAAKLPWMYADASDLVIAEFLVTTFFPRISFSTRLKIINNLGAHLQNPQTADHIFSAIESKYGFPIASAMLPACSEEIIIKFLESNKKHELSPTQLLTLVKTAPNIGLSYLNKLYTTIQNVKSDYSSSLKYLLNHHANETISILTQYPDKWDMSLGTKRSKTILRSSNPEAIELVSKKPNFFKRSQLQKCLSLEQYEQAFLKPGSDIRDMLANTWRATDLIQWLDNLSESHKITLLQKSFRIAFDKEITECPQYVTPDMLILLPMEERMKIIDWKLDSDCCDYIHCQIFKRLPGIYKDYEYLWRSLKPCQDSIPELTKILNSERDLKKRAELFLFLIKSCIFNKDSEALVQVLQLLTRKCRNDQPEVREALALGMNESTFHFEFREEHWSCFQEFLQFVLLYKELENDTNFIELIGKYAVFHLKQGKRFDTELNIIVKLTAKSWLSFDITYVKEPEIQREMLEGYIKAFSAYAENSEITSTHNLVLGLIEDIVRWNELHQRKFDRIDVYNSSWLEEQCWEVFTKESVGNKAVDVNAREIIFKLLRQGSNFGPETLDKLLNNVIINVPVLFYSLKTNPEKIAEHLENIMSRILKTSDTRNFHYFVIFVKKLKAVYDWALLDKIKDQCKKILNHENPKSIVTEIGNAVRLLAIVEPPFDFLTFATNYYPVEAKIDPSVPIDELDYRIKDGIAGSLKYLPGPTLLLPVVDRFLIGDYLKLALRSLYSICSAAPESQVLVYLQSQLKDRPVSVKKHIIRLFFLISPLDGKSTILEEMWTSTKNPSIRYEILIQIYHLFKSTPQGVWKLLKSFMESMTDEDSPCLDFVKNSTVIDEGLDKLPVGYFETILETFKRTGLYKKYEADIISRIANCISKLEANFLDSLIQELVSKIRLSAIYSYSQLTINYLIDESISPQIRAHRLNLVKIAMQDMLEHHWDVTEVNHNIVERLPFPTRNFLARVCREISDTFLGYRGEDKSVDVGKEIIQYFIKHLQEVPDVSKTFRNVIHMELTLVALEIIELEEHDWFKEFGQRVAPLLSVYVEKYGGEIICIVNVILRDVCDRMVATVGRENILRIIDGMLNDNNDKYQLITAIALIPQGIQNATEMVKINKRIMSIIKSCEDPAVRIYFQQRESEETEFQIFNRN